jgi:hypothetical protein
MQPSDKPTTVPPEPAALAELRALARQARGGDVSVLPRIKEILARHPEVWRHIGDVEKIVIRQWAESLSGGEPLAMETLRLKSEEIRAELAGEEATPLEKLLVGQVVVGWLEVGHAQLQVADMKGVTLAEASFDLKQVASAQRRYLAAMKTLATVRRLLRALVPTNPMRLREPARESA